MRTYVPMPWKPHFTRDEAEAALEGAVTWRQVLDALGYRYHGKNIATVRKWAGRWGLSTDHLSDNRGAPRGRVPYSQQELRAAIAASKSWAETLRRLGYCPSGGNWRTLKKRASKLGISTEHFDPYASSRARRRHIPLEDVLVERSTYSRGTLKRRLFESGLKQPRCELCGQGELWRGKRMTLILDHANGSATTTDWRTSASCVPTAPRLSRRTADATSNGPERPGRARGVEHRSPRGRAASVIALVNVGSAGTEAKSNALSVERSSVRPTSNSCARWRRSVTWRSAASRGGDNAVRKWLRQYERERLAAEGIEADVVEIPTRTWPNRRRDKKAA
jgi:hypothetical protein